MTITCSCTKLALAGSMEGNPQAHPFLAANTVLSLIFWLPNCSAPAKIVSDHTQFFDENGCPLLFVSDSNKSSSAAESNQSLAAVTMITIATDRDSTSNVN